MINSVSSLPPHVTNLKMMSMAVVLGTMSAYIMTRFTPFRGKMLFGNLITALLVMPDVITCHQHQIGE
jgi:ABC-type spermidine/putrescine transport system permease subunit II